MKENTIFRKRKISTVLTLGVAGALFSAPTFADNAMDQQIQRDQQIQERQQESQSASSITVDEAAPQVRLEQPAPKVTAQQSKTKVKVETGEPRVSVDQPEPEVSIEQPEPEVSISQSEPNVRINEAEPEVDVNQAEPEVTINRAEPEVEIVERGEQGEQGEQQKERSASASESASASSQSLARVPLDQLTDKEIITQNGEELGSVEDIVADPHGGQAGFVVSVGGFLGIGDTKILVPADEAQLSNDQIVWQTSMSQEQLEKTNEYQSDQYESVTDRYNTLSEATGARVSGRSPE